MDYNNFINQLIYVFEDNKWPCRSKIERFYLETHNKNVWSLRESLEYVDFPYFDNIIFECSVNRHRQKISTIRAYKYYNWVKNSIDCEQCKFCGSRIIHNKKSATHRHFKTKKHYNNIHRFVEIYSDDCIIKDCINIVVKYLIDSY